MNHLKFILKLFVTTEVFLIFFSRKTVGRFCNFYLNVIFVILVNGIQNFNTNLNLNLMDFIFLLFTGEFINKILGKLKKFLSKYFNIYYE